MLRIPLTSLVALLCTLSIALTWRTRYGFQTCAAYSRCGRTNVVNSSLNVVAFHECSLEGAQRDVSLVDAAADMRVPLEVAGEGQAKVLLDA